MDKIVSHQTKADTICTSGRIKSLMATFRIGILPLHIETGRFRDYKTDDRACFICNSGEVENEVHFMCVLLFNC